MGVVAALPTLLERERDGRGGGLRLLVFLVRLLILVLLLIHVHCLGGHCAAAEAAPTAKAPARGRKGDIQRTRPISERGADKFVRTSTHSRAYEYGVGNREAR